MAWNEIAKSAIDFIEKVLERASLWFWLGVAAVALLVADSRGVIPLHQLTSPQTGLKAALVILACLWLNALAVHRPLLQGASALRKRLATRRERWRRNRRASRVASRAAATLRQLLGTRCLERRWLLWFISECEERGEHLLYGTVLHDEEFKGARSLFNLGLLHRTGDNESAFVFLHKKLGEAFYAWLEDDEALRQEIEAEKVKIQQQGRAALTEELPRFATERFFRRLRIDERPVADSE